MFPKNECIERCTRSLVASLANVATECSLHIIDDNSSQATKELLTHIAPAATFDFLPKRDQTGMDARQKSRHSVAVQYEYIKHIPRDELVYIVEDDYLHYPFTLTCMLQTWAHFTSWNTGTRIGLFPQDFNQLYFHPNNPFNETYVRPCHVLPGVDRYWRTTWYTHESFMVEKSVIEDYQEHFDSLLKIGSNLGYWEGNTISNVWQQPEITMLMPLGSIAYHIGSINDISYFANDFERLWDHYGQ